MADKENQPRQRLGPLSTNVAAGPRPPGAVLAASKPTARAASNARLQANSKDQKPPAKAPAKSNAPRVSTSGKPAQPAVRSERKASLSSTGAGATRASADAKQPAARTAFGSRLPSATPRSSGINSSSSSSLEGPSKPAPKAPFQRATAAAPRRSPSSTAPKAPAPPAAPAAATARPASSASQPAPFTSSRPPNSARTSLRAAAPAAPPPAAPAATTATPAAGTSSAPSTSRGPPCTRRLSGLRGGLVNMDKLQSEYEALQQKLVLLKRDSSTNDHSHAHAHSTAAAAGVGSTRPLATPSSVQRGAQQELGQPLHLQSAAPLTHAQVNTDASLQAMADSLQLQCGASLDVTGTLQTLRFSSTYQGSAVGALAGEVFEEGDLLTLCEAALSAQLQRTKEGATAQSRIVELAGLVKQLRRCLRDLMGKSSTFVDKCAKLERDLTQQVEDMKLSSDSALKRLEAEAALARKAAAQTEATYKTERAAWGTDLDMEKFEVGRLKRDLESLNEQRERAREEAKRAEQARMQLEAEIKDLRKASTQQLREVQMTQGEAVRTLSDERQAFERREKELQDANVRLQHDLDASQQASARLQQELSGLRDTQRSLQDSLAGKSSAEAALAVQLSEAQARLAAIEGQLASTESERKQLQQEQSALHDQVMLLQSELKLKGSRMDAAAQQAAQAAAQHAEEKGALQVQLQLEQAEKARALAELSALRPEHDTAKEELVALRQMRKQHEALTTEHAAVAQQLATAESARQQAAEQVEELSEALSDARNALAAAQQDAGTRAARLAHLEGEFEALQEAIGEGEQRDVVTRLLGKISTLQNAAAQAEATRRRLHNELVEVKGNIRVFCRVRPHPTGGSIKLQPGGTSLSLAMDGKEHPFAFDRVFGPNTAQGEVFASVAELVQSALDGYHVCLFSYGQTGAGKTYTMQGGGGGDARGIIPRAVEQILSEVAKLSEQDWQYTLDASFIEVYNNQLRDLLAGTSSGSNGRMLDQSSIKHDPAGGHTVVAGAMRAPVADAEGAAALVAKASAARACEATAMNAVSSRSHVVFMLYISGTHVTSGTKLQGCLCLVDLAGSERLDRSLAEDQRKKEACSINQSLSALGDVFGALSSKSGHVPYRNSKLTWLLQPCLGGHGKTLMFVNINPEPASAHETLCSLKFATKVNGCETAAKGGAKRNVTSSTMSTQDAGGLPDARLALAGSSASNAMHKRPQLSQADRAPKRSKLG